MNKLKLVASQRKRSQVGGQTRHKQAQAKILRWLAFSFDQGLDECENECEHFLKASLVWPEIDPSWHKRVGANKKSKVFF